jgi:hypothetical protein
MIRRNAIKYLAAALVLLSSSRYTLCARVP